MDIYNMPIPYRNLRWDRLGKNLERDNKQVTTGPSSPKVYKPPGV